MWDFLLGENAEWFSVPGVLGTLFFVVRLALDLLGGGLAGMDVNVDLDADLEGPHAESTSVFKFLSVQAVAAFLMGFGWGGLAALKGMGWQMAESFAAGAVAGAGFVWLVAWLLKLVYSLQSSGNIAIGRTVGLEGVVYTGVPAAGEGVGRVTVIVDGRQRTYDARARGEGVERGGRVRVVSVGEDNTLTVEPA